MLESLAFIRQVGHEYDTKQIILFGSCLEKDEDSAGDMPLEVAL